MTLRVADLFAGAGGASTGPFLLPYNSNGGQIARPVSEPLGTITTRDRFALIIPDGADVRHRMLAAHELAAGMGFPPGYRFIGTKADVKKMLGNAWSVRTATALCSTLIDALAPRQSAACVGVA